MPLSGTGREIKLGAWGTRRVSPLSGTGKEIRLGTWGTRQAMPLSDTGKEIRLGAWRSRQATPAQAQCLGKQTARAFDRYWEGTEAGDWLPYSAPVEMGGPRLSQVPRGAEAYGQTPYSVLGDCTFSQISGGKRPEGRDKLQ